jgi:hypothetical protein
LRRRSKPCVAPQARHVLPVLREPAIGKIEDHAVDQPVEQRAAGGDALRRRCRRVVVIDAVAPQAAERGDTVAL